MCTIQWATTSITSPEPSWRHGSRWIRPSPAPSLPIEFRGHAQAASICACPQSPHPIYGPSRILTRTVNIGYQVTLSPSGDCGCRSFSNYRTTVKPSSDNERSTHTSLRETPRSSDWRFVLNHAPLGEWSGFGRCEGSFPPYGVRGKPLPTSRPDLRRAGAVQIFRSAAAEYDADGSLP